MNEQAIRQCYRLLAHEKETEIRTLDFKNNNTPKSYFVTNENDFVQVCQKCNGEVNIYIGVNERTSKGTTAKDVTRIKNIVIDIDAMRPNSTIPATQNELEICYDLITEIMTNCVVAGLNAPIIAYTGNGYQLWFPIPAIEITDENREETEKRIKTFQDSLRKKYNPLKKGKIDQIGDLPRIVRVIGTTNMKGGKESRFITEPTRKEDTQLLTEIMEYETTEEHNTITQDEFKNKSDSEIRKILEKPDILKLYYGDITGYLSRSEAEMALLKRLILNELNEQQCYAIMEAARIGKWKQSKQAYKDLTYTNAVSFASQQKIEDAERAAQREQERANYLADVTFFHSHHPFFFDESQLFWQWDAERFAWKITDETNLFNALEKKLGLNGKTILSVHKSCYLEAMKRIGRQKKPQPLSKTSVQFKQKIFDIKTREITESSPEVFACNPIPYELSNNADTPVIDKLIKEWVEEQYLPTIYEIIAYCCLIDYPIHRVFCLIGGGSNGKSRLLALIQKFVGIDNCTSTDLDVLINNRFESAKLHKKLVCIMGETNFNILNKTSIIKKLVGQDLIGFEFKNKMPFSDENYAKVLIGSNQLPICEDTSDGFYRRWIIIDFPNQFTEGKDILQTIPEEEYNNLARKVVNTLPALLESGSFTNEGTIAERKQRYELASNPFNLFVSASCNVSMDACVKLTHLYAAYLNYLTSIKKRKISTQQFRKIVELEGFEINRTTEKVGEYSVSANWVYGLFLKDNWQDMFVRN